MIAVELLSIGEAVQVWWPVMVSCLLAVLWFARIEGKTRELAQADIEATKAATERWSSNERESVPKMKRIDDALARIEIKQSSNSIKIDDIGSRLTRVETVMNGAVLKWDRLTERRRSHMSHDDGSEDRG